ncbi:TPA: hypothetical protein N0F65_008479 [Lagenidium giganteum]|uniref:C2 domain-containing protein n=1 Tax=Lagenidium giganteum TaxID=4803 RepID=A0AAV2Z0I5_9STRA|nr:TPA: hypothetical protein N0F65_008479 [Lagenidium giganteum]
MELSQVTAPEPAPRKDSSDISSGSPKSPEVLAPLLAVNVKMCFLCADTALALSCIAPARLILPGSANVRELVTTEVSAALHEVVLECVMPALPFSGPTIVSVSIEDVTFSNFVCVHCYDPRQWRVTQVLPPCGLLRKSQALRIKGINFVENRKLVVRLSDAWRYVNVEAAVEKMHVLVIRVVSVRSLKALLPLSTLTLLQQATASQLTQRKDDEPKTTPAMLMLPTPVSICVRLECGDQSMQATCRDSTLAAAIHTGAALSWEEQFEIKVPSRKANVLVVVEAVDATLPRPLELARAVVSIIDLQEGVLTRKAYPLEEHFRRLTQQVAGGPNGASGASTSSGWGTTTHGNELELLLHMSPQMLNTDYVVCNVRSLRVAQKLHVQISSGDALFSNLDDPTVVFQAYELPRVVRTAPNVLPRSAGGDVTIHGDGFIDCNGGRAQVRLFGCLKRQLTTAQERQLMDRINGVSALQAASPDWFVRDLEGLVVSPTMIKCTVPAHLACYTAFYRVSFDGREFTDATEQTRVLMFSADSIEPKGGPVGGNTYASLHGTNIAVCMASQLLQPQVRLTWMRGARELESVVVPGEFYAPEDTVFFYTPQSKFGLHNISVNVELSLSIPSTPAPTVGAESSSSIGATSTSMATISSTAMVPPAWSRFSQDEITFVMYKMPSVKAVTPVASLICGLTTMEMFVQGLDDKSLGSMRSAHKVRFKRRGQMQLADALLVGDSSKFTFTTPRFNVSCALPVELPASAITSSGSSSSPPKPQQQQQQAQQPTPVVVSGPTPKLWNRTTGLYVALLRARSLHVSKKSTCNPFCVIKAGRLHFRSTRKDGTLTPIWNELFDFEWQAHQPDSDVILRIYVKNQLNMDQSELLGHVELRLNGTDWKQPFACRAWVALHKPPVKPTTITRTSFISDHDRPKPAIDLGEIEIFVGFIPPVVKRLGNVLGRAQGLKSTILSALSNRRPLPHEDAAKRKKEKILRVFRQLSSAQPALIPSEVTVELALNGQDFWSVAPAKCYMAPTPILIAAEPSFVCITGGTQVTLTGVNFVASACLKVAWVGSHVVDGREEIEAAKVVVVDAKYRSATSLTCVAPPLQRIAHEHAAVSLYVSVNGEDFDSVALPQRTLKVQDGAQVDGRVEDEGTGNKRRSLPSGNNNNNPSSSDPAAIVFRKDYYHVDCGLLVKNSREQQERVGPRAVLRHSVRVFLFPVLRCVRAADGVYTSTLVIEGRDFTDTRIAVAKFVSQADETDQRMSRVRVLSSTRMECSMPDFPRGVLVRMAVAMNGVEFVPCPGVIEVFQSPKLTAVTPHWVSSLTQTTLLLQGVNFTTNGTDTVQVQFVRNDRRRVVAGTCVDGAISCQIPSELLQQCSQPSPSRSSARRQIQDAASDPTTALCTPNTAASAAAPTDNNQILVDVWLGGIHKTFTGSPMPIVIYRDAPTITSISPMNGPVYGGFSVIIEGRGFLNTGAIVVRFQLFHEDALMDAQDGTDAKSASSSSPDKPTTSEVTTTTAQGTPGSTTTDPTTSTESTVVFAQCDARYLSSERVQCTAPSFPREGVYMVTLSLNGLEYSRVNASTWFLVWHNWQRRKQLLSHSLFSSNVVAEAVAAKVNDGAANELDPDTLANSAAPKSDISIPTTPTTPGGSGGVLLPQLDESDIMLLRRKSSFMKPTTPSDRRNTGRASLPLVLGAGTSVDPSLFMTSPRWDDTANDDDDVDIEQLQWHPASVEDRSRSLVSILEELCSSPETVPIMTRRIGVIFRLKAKNQDKQQQQKRSEQNPTQHPKPPPPPQLTRQTLLEGMKWIFPRATEPDLDEFWQVVDIRKVGRVTFEQVLRAFIRQNRSASPEPGPTHYHPHYQLVEPKPPNPLILPPTEVSAEVTGLPSELFMNYDSYKVVKQRAPGAIFPRRKGGGASWCDPVPKDVQHGLVQDKTKDSDQVLVELRKILDTANCPPANRRARRGSVSAEDPSAPSTPATTPAAPTTPSRTRTRRMATSHRSRAAPPTPRMEPSDPPSKEDGVRTPRIVTGNGGAGATTPAAPRPHQIDRAQVRSLLFNDIAPMYLKFLNSKEAQKSMKQ